MTLDAALQEVFDTTDRQDDLDPATAQGRARLVSALTRAAAIVATWRFPDGYRLHFRALEDEAYVTLGVRTGIVQMHDDRTFTLETADAGRQLVGWSLAVPDAQYEGLIVAQVGAAVTVAEAPTAAAPLTFETYRLSHAVWQYGAGGDELAIAPEPVETIGLFDVARQTDLTMAHDLERMRATRAAQGTPSQFSKFRHGFVLDASPDAETLLLVSYVHYPQVGTLGTDALCELPEAFHEAIVQWARYWAFDRGGDVLAAQTALSKLEKDMRGLRSEEDLGSDYVDARIDARLAR